MMVSRARIKQRTKQAGVALISVLLAVALCTILAAEMLTEQSLQVQRVQNLFQRQQAYWYALGSEQFVKGLITKTADDDEGIFHLGQDWAMDDMSFPVDDGLIEGKIYDLNACFNLNSLYNSEWDDDAREAHKKVFVRYLNLLELESEISEDDLANNLVDWLDKDDYPTGAVGYDGDMYASLDFPYLSANSPMAAESELRLVYGFDAQLVDQLKNKFCVIPDSQMFIINVNTVDEDNAALLAAMLDVDVAKAESIISSRPEDGFEKIEDFWDSKDVAALKNVADLDKSQFTVNSKFFKLITNAYYNEVRFDLTSVLQLDEQNAVHVLARRFGGTIERKADPETEQSEQ